MDYKRYTAADGEKPLDNIKPNGGFCAIFRTIGCIGDSLSSGEFESTSPDGKTKGYHDYFEYSWGQYMARAMGNTVYNFSRGGMTAKEYMTNFGEAKGFFDPALACQCYVIALGVNDLLGRNMEVGTVEDLPESSDEDVKETFAGWYGKLIAKYKEISPDAKFFLMTMANESDSTETKLERIKAHRELLYAIAQKLPNTYVIDLYEYAPKYDGEFKKLFYLGGHLNPMGYIVTAEMTMSYIDYVIRKNPEDFLQVGFIGKGIHNYNAKW